VLFAGRTSAYPCSLMSRRRSRCPGAIARWWDSLTRRAWPRGISLLWSAGAILTTVSPAPAADAGGSEVFLRGTGEGSLVTWPVNYQLKLERSGAALSTPIDTTDSDVMLGGRVEVAYLSAHRLRFAAGPRLSYGLATTPAPNERVLQTELDRYVMRGDSSLHTVTVGGEVQFQRRQIVLAADLGIVHVVERGTVEGPDLRGRFSGKTTLPILRLGVGGRLRLGSHLAATSLLSGEYGFEMATYQEVASLARATLAVGLDLRTKVSQ
jgi:hypothetical protein